jgi:hypothetical protein
MTSKQIDALTHLLEYSLGQDLMDKANGVLEWELDGYATHMLKEVLGQEVYDVLRKKVYPDGDS